MVRPKTNGRPLADPGNPAKKQISYPYNNLQTHELTGKLLISIYLHFCRSLLFIMTTTLVNT